MHTVLSENICNFPFQTNPFFPNPINSVQCRLDAIEEEKINLFNPVRIFVKLLIFIVHSTKRILLEFLVDQRVKIFNPLVIYWDLLFIRVSAGAKDNFNHRDISRANILWLRMTPSLGTTQWIYCCTHCAFRWRQQQQQYIESKMKRWR